MVKVALVVSIIALAVCLLIALNGILSDGLKGLKQKSKPIGISFLIYAVAFLLFIFFQWYCQELCAKSVCRLRLNEVSQQ